MEADNLKQPLHSTWRNINTSGIIEVSPSPRPLSPMAVLSKPLTLLGLLGVATAVWVNPATLDACPGYKAANVKSDGSTLTADLSLAGKACNVFGTDIQQLKLEVAYETGEIFCFRPPRIY